MLKLIISYLALLLCSGLLFCGVVYEDSGLIALSIVCIMMVIPIIAIAHHLASEAKKPIKKEIPFEDA